MNSSYSLPSYAIATLYAILMTCLPISITAQEKPDKGVKEKMLLSLLSNPDTSLKEQFILTDSLMRIAPDNVEYMLQHANAAMHLGEFENAQKVLETADLKSRNLDTSIQTHTKLQQVRLNRMQGKIVNAVMDATELLNISKPDSLKYMDIEISLFLADGYLNLGSVNLSKIYFEDAKKRIVNAHGMTADRKEDFINNSLAIEAQIELYEGHKEKALNLVLEAIKHKASDEHSTFLKLLMGAIYEELGEYDHAMNLYRDLLDSKRISWWNAMALPRYVDLLARQKRGEEIDSVISRYSDLEKMVNRTHRGISMDYVRAMYLKDTGRDSEAWDLMKGAYSRLNDFAFYHAHGSQQADVIYETMAVKQSEYQKKIKRAKTLMWVSISLLVVTLINFFFMLRKIIQKKRKIDALNTSMNEKTTAFELKENEFRHSLDSRAHELMGVTMMISRLNGLTDAIRTTLNSKDSANQKVTEIVSLLDSSVLSEDTDKMLKVQFSLTHGNLIDRLMEAHPNLTNGEQKMAIYILLGYTTREIAEITFRSPRSVETMKYRMAKKILSNSDISLEDYLKTYLSPNS